MARIFKQNDNAVLAAQLINPVTEEPFDLSASGVDYVQLLVEDDESGDLVVNEDTTGPVDITNAEQGRVEYEFDQTETTREGRHNAEFHVHFDDGGRLTHPNQGFIRIDIEEEIDPQQDLEIVADPDASVSTLFAKTIAANDQATVDLASDLDLQANDLINFDFPDSSVDTAELVDGAVTTPKIATGAVSNTKLANTDVAFNDVSATLGGGGATLALRDLRVTTSVGAATTTNGEDTVFVDPSGTGGVTITLASADAAAGQEVTIQDVGGTAGSNTITVDTEGTEVFGDGDSAKTITEDRGWLTVRWDGSNWVSDRYAEFEAVRAGSLTTKTLTTDIEFARDYPTLQDAINAAQGGGTLVLGAETYSADPVVTDDITMLGRTLDAPIIDGKLTVDDAPFTCLERIRFDGDGTRAVDFDSYAGIIHNCRLLDDLQLGTSSAGSGRMRVQDNQLTGNDITILSNSNRALIDGNQHLGTVTDNSGTAQIGFNG